MNDGKKEEGKVTEEGKRCCRSQEEVNTVHADAADRSGSLLRTLREECRIVL